MTEPWQEILAGQADAVLARRKTKKAPHRDFRCRIPMSAVPVLIEAARRRGMSASAYNRRAALAFAAYDLGLDLKQVLADEPPTRASFYEPLGGESKGGEGHGPWEIKGLR